MNFFLKNKSRFCLILLGWLWFLGGIPQPVKAQYGSFGDDLLGVGLWLSLENIQIKQDASSFPRRVQGYAEVLPKSMNGLALGIGLSVQSLGISFELGQAEASIGKDANIQQNEDTSDDVSVRKAYRRTFAWSIQHTLGAFYYGYGEENGNFEFEITPPAGKEKTQRIGFYAPHVLAGLLFNFNGVVFPRPLDVLLTVFVKAPIRSTYFYDPVVGVGVTGGFY